MSFTVPDGMQQQAQKIIDNYFSALQKNGPAGMRSQCYASDEDDSNFVHIKGFKRESIANQHFRSGIYKDYIQALQAICPERQLSFSKLQQQKTFESIY
jgi:hypothetical protein